MPGAGAIEVPVVGLCESRRSQERAMEEGLEERGLSGSLDSAFLF